MGLKGGRKLIIGEDTYRWKVSGRGGLHVAIEKEGEKGRKVVWLEDGQAVTPSMVKKLIEIEWPIV